MLAWCATSGLIFTTSAALPAAHNKYGSITGRAAPPGQPWVKAFNVFNALGSIAFAYNFTGVLMEIQVGRQIVHTVSDIRDEGLVPEHLWLAALDTSDKHRKRAWPARQLIQQGRQC